MPQTIHNLHSEAYFYIINYTPNYSNEELLTMYDEIVKELENKGVDINNMK